MKTGKRILKKIQGWASPSGNSQEPPTTSAPQQFSNDTSVMSIGTVNYVPLASKQLPAWQVRRRNRSMPRPKSTGYLKDFNILSEEDDVEDDTNRPYDDSVLSRDVGQRVDCILPRDVPTNHGCYHNYINMNGDVSINDRNRCVPNGDLNEQGDRAIARDVRSTDAYVLTRDVSGRAAYWQGREDESKKVPERASTSSSIKRNWKTPGQIRQLRNEVDPTQMTQFIYDKGVANRAAMWQKLEDDHFEKMMINPDKEWKGPVKWVVLDKNHPDYGRPPKGSKTEKRGIKAHKHVVKEIGELCKIIAENGERQKDGTVTITFRKLFHTYVSISNKVVGILIRARKRGLLHFNGEMLYQRQDEDEIIQLFPETDLLE